MKKTQASLALLAAVATLLAGCGNSSSSGQRLAKDGKPQVDALVVKNANTAAMKNMQWPKKLEAMCNCHINWKEVDMAGMATAAKCNACWRKHC
jgi:putative aldouronate transport system substrate-binding protein